MAIVREAYTTTAAFGGATTIVSPAFNSGSADFIVVSIYSTEGISSVSDSEGNSYTVISGTGNNLIAYATGVTNASNLVITITLTGSSTLRLAFFVAYSGVDQTTPYYGYDDTFSAGDNTFNVIGAGDSIICFFSDTGTIASYGTGQTEIDQINAFGSVYLSATEELGMSTGNDTQESDATSGAGIIMTEASTGLSSSISTSSSTLSDLTGKGLGIKFQDIKIQHIEYDMPGGTTRTLVAGTDFDAVADLDHAFILLANNHRTGAGQNGATATTMNLDDMGANIYFNPANGNIELASNSGATRRLSFFIVEYTGDPGGANEFTVIDRGTISASVSATSESRTLASTPSNIDKCVPFYNLANNYGSAGAGNSLTLSIWCSGTNTLNYHRGGNQGNLSTRVEVVEFNGSNWNIGHRSYIGANDGPLDLTIYNNADGTSGGGTFDVGDWSTAMIWHTFSGDKNSNTNQAIEDICPLYYPPSGGGTTAVTVEFTVGHGSDGTNNFFFHVIQNDQLNVTRFYISGITASAEGENIVDITSAGISSLDTALVHGTSVSTGGGTAFMRGWRNYYLKNLVQAAHWCHRSGNTMEHRLEVVDFNELFTYWGADINTDSTVTGTLTNAATSSPITSSITTDSTVSGTLSAIGELADTIATDSSITASLLATANLASAINTDSTISALLIAQTSIDSSINTDSSITASLSGTGSMGSMVTTDSTITATLISNAIGANINTDSSVTASLTGNGELQSLINTLSTPSGTATARADIDSSIFTDSTVTGLLSASAILASSISTDSTISATLSATGDLASSVSTESTVSGSITATVPIQSDINTDSTVTGTLTGMTFISSSINTNSTVTGTLLSIGVLETTVTTDSTPTSVLTGIGALNASINSTSVVSGLIVGKYLITSAVNTYSVVTATAIQTILIDASINTYSTVEGYVLQTLEIDASINTNSTISATLTGTGKLLATINTLSTISGTITGIFDPIVQIFSSIQTYSVVTAFITRIGGEEIVCSFEVNYISEIYTVDYQETINEVIYTDKELLVDYKDNVYEVKYIEETKPLNYLCKA